MQSSDEASEPCLFTDLEEGTINVLVKEHGDNLTDFSDIGCLPNHTPPLMMSRSEPLPRKDMSSFSSSSLDMPSRTRCSTNPENFTAKDKTHRKHSLLLSAFNTYTGVLPSFLIPTLRRVSTGGSATPSVPLFLCAICMENHGVYDSFTLQDCTAQHTFCRESMTMYLSSQISDGVVTTLKCPCYGMDSCDAVFTSLEVQSLVPEKCYQQYTRLLEIKTNPNARECPSCSTFTTTGSEENPEITCHECDTLFCYLHNNAHPSLTCQQYIRRTAKSDMRSAATIKATARTCPKCKAPTQKSSGCNHMTCQHCHEDWCWLCGRHMEDNHYEGLSPCSGQQFGLAPPFALWSFFPCLRWSCFAYINLFLHFLVLFVLGVILFVFACASLPVSIALCPFSLLFMYFSSESAGVLIMPALAAMVCLCSVFLLSLQLIYLPIPILVTLIKLVVNGCDCIDVKYFPWQEEGEIFDEETPILELWFYPLYLLRSFAPFDEDD